MCRSTRPGPTRQPAASRTVAPLGGVDRRRPRRRTTAPPTATSARPEPLGADDRSAAQNEGDLGLRQRPAPPPQPDRSPPSSRKRIAMRTATPFATCWVTTVRGRSATSDAISTPRTIGPGCVTMASSRRRATRRAVRPHPAVYSRRLGTKEPLPRSACRRSSDTTSASPRASSRSAATSTGQPSSDGGRRLPGDARVTRAPRAV